MSSLAYRLRADLRVGWRSLVAVALLIGLAGGAALGGLAAARRTASAYERMRRATDAWDVIVNPNNGDRSKLSPARLARVPGITSMGVVNGISVLPADVTTTGQIVSDLITGAPTAALDRQTGYTVDRPVILRGHMPAPTDENAVYVDRTFASNYHLHVGQLVPLVVLSQHLQRELAQAGNAQQVLSLIHTAPTSLHTTVRVAGIGVTADAIVVDQGYAPMGILFTQAFWRRHTNASAGWWSAAVTLRRGTSVASFTAAVQRMAPGESIAFHARLGGDRRGERRRRTERRRAGGVCRAGRDPRRCGRGTVRLPPDAGRCADEPDAHGNRCHPLAAGCLPRWPRPGSPPSWALGWLSPSRSRPPRSHRWGWYASQRSIPGSPGTRRCSSVGSWRSWSSSLPARRSPPGAGPGSVPPAWRHAGHASPRCSHARGPRSPQ